MQSNDGGGPVTAFMDSWDKKIDANLLWRILGSNNQVVDYIVW